MKNFTLHLFLICLLGISFSNYSQDSLEYAENDLEDIIDYDVFHGLSNQLDNIDTIPGFESKTNKLKIYGTIYKSDGVTPAKDVILYIEQADEHGNFDLRKENDKRYVHNRGWIKTDSDGNYTFYTYIPGNDRRYNQMQQLFPIIKEPSKPEYAIGTFLFDEDPLLSKLCRKRLSKKGDITRILKLTKEDDLFVTKKDIKLREGLAMAD